MTKRKQSSYATKRKMRLVPLQFSANCSELCAALRDDRTSDERLNALRWAFAASCERSDAGALHNWPPRKFAEEHVL